MATPALPADEDDDRPPLLREVDEYRDMVSALRVELDDLRASETVPVAAVKDFLTAVDAYLAAGSSGAVGAWRGLKVAREKLDVLVGGDAE